MTLLTIWQFGIADNLALLTIWHCWQFDNVDNCVFQTGLIPSILIWNWSKPFNKDLHIRDSWSKQIWKCHRLEPSQHIFAYEAPLQSWQNWLSNVSLHNSGDKVCRRVNNNILPNLSTLSQILKHFQSKTMRVQCTQHISTIKCLLYKIIRNL